VSETLTTCEKSATAGIELVCADAVGLVFAGPVIALEGVSFSLAQGEFVAIVGPSGCGKSTVLRLIAGLLSASRGRITVAGTSPQLARRERTRMSLVFQDATLLPWRNVESNIRLPLELQKKPRHEHAVLVGQGLAMIGLADFAKRYPNQLSGGMRMRVSLARALVTAPDMLLLDEPFAALDDITRQELNDELHQLWDRHRWTGVFVTHNIAEAVFLSQRILVMSARPGRVVAEIAVPFASPRSPELRTTPEFAQLTAQVSACLRRASG
jgi:NitT/TauT family transport system ATP-binding protein